MYFESRFLTIGRAFEEQAAQITQLEAEKAELLETIDVLEKRLEGGAICGWLDGQQEADT